MPATLCQQISCRLGAEYTRIVSVDLPDPSWFGDRRLWLVRLCAVLRIPTEGAGRAILVQSLGSRPVWCPNLKQLGSAARSRHSALVIDNTVPTSFGCMSVRQGAHVSVESLARSLGDVGAGFVAVSLSRDAAEVLPQLSDSLEDLPAPPPEILAVWQAALPSFEVRRRRANDAALVIASYLRCHPKVGHVWYPGLLRSASDPSRPEGRNLAAPSMLLDGFGPLIDWRLKADRSIRRYVVDGRDARAQVASFEEMLAHFPV